MAARRAAVPFASCPMRFRCCVAATPQSRELHAYSATVAGEEVTAVLMHHTPAVRHLRSAGRHRQCEIRCHVAGDGWPCRL